MHFEVQGQNYILGFHQAEGRWYLLKPTAHGVDGIPVIDDGANRPDALAMDEEQDEHTVIN